MSGDYTGRSPHSRSRWTRSYWTMIGCIAASALVILVIQTGCGSDSGGGPEPVTSVSLPLNSTNVEICLTLQLAAQVTGGESKDVNWYVNGTLGGNATVGTISQANPATYTAPASVPAPATVTVKAVSREDTTKFDSCLVTVKLTTVHVNVSTGNDETGTGCVTAPFRTVTAGLAAADSGMTVLVAPGTYGVPLGEQSHAYIPKGVSLVGENRETTILNQGCDFYAADAALRNVTIDGADLPAAVHHLAYITTGAPNAVVDSVTFIGRAFWSVVRIDAAANATVSNCSFVVNDAQRLSRGMEIVFGDSGSIVRGCVFTGFNESIVLNSTSDALIEGCTFDGNASGVTACCLNTPDHNANPDLGGGARGSLGGNTFGDNTAGGLLNLTTNAIYAKHNTWAHTPPVAGVDYINMGTGSVIVE
jgi:hypothetical protein